VTGVNGTALVVAAGSPVNYSGIGGSLPAECQWETHLGSAPPFVLWVQDFRPKNQAGKICDR
jgi:hypothetical protein